MILWKSLKERYDHQKIAILPRARYDWIHLRLQDFKSITEYNSVLFKISSQLKLCGEKVSDKDMLEKTYTTFHIFNMLLQQQYRERRLSALIACLLVAEQNKELLLKNHQSHPTGSISLPEANATIQTNRCGCGCGRGHGYFYGQGRGYSCGSLLCHIYALIFVLEKTSYSFSNGSNAKLFPFILTLTMSLPSTSLIRH